MQYHCPQCGLFASSFHSLDTHIFDHMEYPNIRKRSRWHKVLNTCQSASPVLLSMAAIPLNHLDNLPHYVFAWTRNLLEAVYIMKAQKTMAKAEATTKHSQFVTSLARYIRRKTQELRRTKLRSCSCRSRNTLPLKSSHNFRTDFVSFLPIFRFFFTTITDFLTLRPSSKRILNGKLPVMITIEKNAYIALICAEQCIH